MLARHVAPWALALTVVLGLSLSARAADEKKADATGTWTWKTTGRQNQNEVTWTLKLKQDGEKVTGTIKGMGDQVTEIKDGKIDKDGNIAFAVTRTRNDQEMTTKYTGKLDGDTIKGKSERQGGQNAQPRDWEAKRSKE